MKSQRLGLPLSILSLAAGLLACSSSPAQPEGGEAESLVTLLETVSCEAFGHDVECLTLSVTSEGLPPRQLTVRRFARTGSQGALILTRGGTGNQWYSGYGPEAESTIETAFTAGLEVYEFKWSGVMGWAEGAEGARGYDRAVGAYSHVLRWLADNVMDNPGGFLIAQGNSGGSVQIAFGLALYGLEEILDVAILSGGPPVADLRRAIFGEASDIALWPDGLYGFEFTDYLMGWSGNGDYCVQRSVPPEMEEEIFAALDSVSLVSPTAPRDHDLATTVHFVQTNDITNADDQALLYHDALVAEKHWHYLGGISDHAVPGTPQGAAMIRQLILDALPVTTAARERDLTQSPVRVAPNPFRSETTLSFSLQREARVRLGVFSPEGRLLKRLLRAELPVGPQELVWHGRDDQGRELPSGIYLLKIEIDGHEASAQRITLLR